MKKLNLQEVTQHVKDLVFRKRSRSRTHPHNFEVFNYQKLGVTNEILRLAILANGLESAYKAERSMLISVRLGKCDYCGQSLTI